MKIYTKSGDKGQTSLFDGSRVSKADEKIELLGSLDSLNAYTGLLISHLENEGEQSEIRNFLERIQNNIFSLSSEIANPKLKEEDFNDFSTLTSQLEAEMDKMDSKLPELKNFILPGGTIEASIAHLCRTEARKCERQFVKILIEVEQEIIINTSSQAFLNRISDYFFVLARFLNKKEGLDDIVWRINSN